MRPGDRQIHRSHCLMLTVLRELTLDYLQLNMDVTEENWDGCRVEQRFGDYKSYLQQCLRAFGLKTEVVNDQMV